MGLGEALSRLHGDMATDLARRDVLVVFRKNPHEWLSLETVARKAGRPQALVDRILLTLAETFVLDFDSEHERYRYRPSGLLELDIHDYLARVDRLNDRLQDNVARFRQRHGY